MFNVVRARMFKKVIKGNEISKIKQKVLTAILVKITFF